MGHLQMKKGVYMITVKGKCTCPANKETGSITFARAYLHHEGLECKQTRVMAKEGDYQNGEMCRYSPDNGKTWSDWEPVKREEYSVFYGEDEMTTNKTPEKWNPVHRHFVSTVFTRYFLEGHHKAYEKFWGKAEAAFLDHQYIAIREPEAQGAYVTQLVRYEAGNDFHGDDPRDPEFLYKNRGFLNEPIILDCGDIAVPVGVPVDVGCRIAGVDVKRVFPSCPNIHRCVIVARGRFNKTTEQYDFTFSNPVILGDLRSSRGIDEPILAQLKSGRLLLVMRGSNVSRKQWSTRIEKGTPSFKWYAWSDDGGKTFTDPEPWHFDDGEVIYSGATISNLVRSSKNGKLYWFGNIAPHTAYGNWPRYPLHMVQVDEQTGAAMKDTLTVIDTRRPGETELVQLSNFNILEDRETGCFELTLSKINQFDEKDGFWGESWQYDIDPGE